MADTSSRTLQLLSLLQTHRYWPGQELARRLGVSIRTLRRDVDRLRDLGYPVSAQRGVDGGYQLTPGASLPPLVLDDEEAVALTIGLLGAARSSIAGTAEASVRALAKVTQVMPRRLRQRVQAVQTMTEPLPWLGDTEQIEPDTLTSLASACRDRECVEFDYTTAAGDAARRRVEPARLVPFGRRWYLVAYDLDRHDWRSFRLDRLRSPRSTGRSFAPRRLPAEDAAAFVRAGLARRDRSAPVTAEVDAAADSVRTNIGRWATVEPIGADRCRVVIQTDSLPWAAAALVLTGAAVHRVSPAAFEAYLQATAGRLSAGSVSSSRVAPEPPG